MKNTKEQKGITNVGATSSGPQICEKYLKKSNRNHTNRVGGNGNCASNPGSSDNKSSIRRKWNNNESTGSSK